MDIDKALAELRAAFPRVEWTATEDEPGDFNIHGGPLFLWSTMGHWYCNNAVEGDPVSAVRAWLTAQPTAAFYPEPPSGETVEVRGWVAVNDADDYAFAPDGGPGDEWDARQDAIDGLRHHGDPIVHRFTLRVPLPVEPPVLVGEVEP